MWGWLKPVLDFFRDLVGDILKHEVKATDAKTTDETKERFNAMRNRIKPEPPPEPPADGDPRHR